jgi:hypothetical protein
MAPGTKRSIPQDSQVLENHKGKCFRIAGVRTTIIDERPAHLGTRIS